MIRVTARAFAADVAVRHGAVRGRPPGLARVLVRLARGRTTIRRSRGVALQLAVRVTHARVTDAFVPAQTAKTVTIERLTRHEVTASRIIERTRRVEPVSARAAMLQGAGVRTSPPGATSGAPRLPLLAPPLPRVLRQAPSAERAKDHAEHRTATAVVPRTAPAVLTPGEIARLTDEVMRGIDKRLIAYRERRGRV